MEPKRKLSLSLIRFFYLIAKGMDFYSLAIALGSLIGMIQNSLRAGSTDLGIAALTV